MLGLQSCSAMSNLCSPTQPNIHVSQGCCLRPSRRSQRRATRTRVQRNQRNLRNPKIPKIPRTKKISRRMLDWTLNLICTCSEPQSFGFPKVSAKTVPFATCFNFNVVFSQMDVGLFRDWKYKTGQLDQEIYENSMNRTVGSTS